MIPASAAGSTEVRLAVAGWEVGVEAHPERTAAHPMIRQKPHAGERFINRILTGYLCQLPWLRRHLMAQGMVRPNDRLCRL
jgi:hypothetical protein